MNLSSNARGVLLATIGVVVLSPDSLLIRLIDIDLWTLMFLRGLFMAISFFLFNSLINQPQALREYSHIDRWSWGIILMMTGSSIFFVWSIQTTSVAHTLIIVGAAPVFAALLGMIFLKESVPLMTWLTIFIVVSGLVFVVNDGEKSSLLGDLYAMIACLLWSTIFVLSRKTRMRNMLSVMSVSGLLMALTSLPMVTLQSLTIHQILLSLLMGIMVGLALSLITLAPRHIPAAEVAVFMPLEAVFGSLLVWWFVGEYPGVVSLSAGMVIIAAIMLNSYYQFKYSK